MDFSEGMGLAAAGCGLLWLGLQLLARGALRACTDALPGWLNWMDAHPRRALAGGALAGVVAQSSAAVLSPTLGVLNSGLLRLEGGLWLLAGLSTGAVATGWLALASAQPGWPEELAWALLALGMLAAPRGGQRQRGIARMLLGAGLLLHGLTLLASGLAGIAAQLELPDTAPLAGTALGALLLGFAGAAWLRAASVVIALAFTALTAGMIPIWAAALALVGATLGTLPDALAALRHGTAATRRLALAHLGLACVQASAGIALLPVFLLSALPPSSLTLALFHSGLLMISLLLLLPLSGMAREALSRLFAGQDEDPATPHSLDDHITTLPSLARQALRLEAERLLQSARAALLPPLSSPASAMEAPLAWQAIDTLGSALLARVHALPEDLRDGMAEGLHGLTEAGELLAQLSPGCEDHQLPHQAYELRYRHLEAVRRLLGLLTLQRSPADIEGSLDALEEKHWQCREALIDAGEAQHLPLRLVAGELERLAQLQALARRMAWVHACFSTADPEQD